MVVVVPFSFPDCLIEHSIYFSSIHVEEEVPMKIAWQISLALAIVQCVSGCTSTAWPPYMPYSFPGQSTSPVAAVLPEGIKIEPPAKNVPADKARWSGSWKGWACEDRVCDTRLVVETVDANRASIVYAFASATMKPLTQRVEGTFVGDELQGTTYGGNRIVYRFRSSGEIEFLWFRPGYAARTGGILTKDH